MQIQIFNVQLTDGVEGLSEMNRFLTSHKVLEVEQQFFGNANGGLWSFCVRYLPLANGSASLCRDGARPSLLLTVNGIGIKKVEKYGQQVLYMLTAVETGHAPSSS